MSERAQALARQFTAANDELIGELTRYAEADWRAGCPDVGWSVGVTAHHLASDLPVLLGMVSAVAKGEPLAALTPEFINAFNAEHATNFANAGKDETLALLRGEGLTTALTLSAFSDEELSRTAPPPWGGAPISAEQLAQALLIGHIPEHLAGMRQAVGTAATATR